MELREFVEPSDIEPTKRASAGQLAADLLTWSRLGVALALPLVLWSASLTPAVFLVSWAWISDLLDGRLARGSGREGRMGRWDLAVDTAVGGGIAIGLAGMGEVPAWFAASSILLFGGWWLLMGKPAGSMLLQLSGYVPLLRVLWNEQPPWWWLPFATAALTVMVDWRRLVEVNIPGFLQSFRPTR